MRSVAAEVPASNVIPFRRPNSGPSHGLGFAPAGSARLHDGGSRGGRDRSDQRNLMDLVYATGAFILAADDRETKLVASRLQVYGFIVIEEIGEDGAPRRLRPSEAIRARLERPWRLSKASYGSGLAVTIPPVDDFLFEPAGLPA